MNSPYSTEEQFSNKEGFYEHLKNGGIAGNSIVQYRYKNGSYQVNVLSCGWVYDIDNWIDDVKIKTIYKKQIGVNND